MLERRAPAIAIGVILITVVTACGGGLGDASPGASSNPIMPASANSPLGVEVTAVPALTLPSPTASSSPPSMVASTTAPVAAATIATVTPELTGIDDVCSVLFAVGVKEALAGEAGSDDSVSTLPQPSDAPVGCRFISGEVRDGDLSKPAILVTVTYVVETEMRGFWSGAPFDQFSDVFDEEHQGLPASIAGGTTVGPGYTVNLLQPVLDRGIQVGVAIEVPVAAEFGYDARMIALAVMSAARTAARPSGPGTPGSTTTTSTAAAAIVVGDEPTELRSILTALAEAPLALGSTTLSLDIDGVVSARHTSSTWLDVNTLTGNKLSHGEHHVIDRLKLARIYDKDSYPRPDTPSEGWSEQRLVGGVDWTSPVVPIDPLGFSTQWWGNPIPNRDVFDKAHVASTYDPSTSLRGLAAKLTVITGRSVDADGSIEFDVAGTWQPSGFGFTQQPFQSDETTITVTGRISVSADLRSVRAEIDMSPYWVAVVARHRPDAIEIARSMTSHYTVEFTVVDQPPSELASPCEQPTLSADSRVLSCPGDPATVRRGP